MSASALASSSAISASSRARPSASSASAWASASASMRGRSASMSPSAWRIRAASASALGLRLRPHSSSSGLDACGAGREGLLGQRPGLPEQQAEDDDRGEAAGRIRLVALRPEPMSAIWSMCSSSSATAMSTPVERRHRSHPRAHHLGDGASQRRPSSGAPAGAQLDGAGGDAGDRVLDAGAGGAPGLLGLRGGGGPSLGDRRVDLGDPIGALAVELVAGGVDASRGLRPHRGELRLVLGDAPRERRRVSASASSSRSGSAVARLHALAAPRGRGTAASASEEHDERAEAPDQLLASGAIGLGTFLGLGRLLGRPPRPPVTCSAECRTTRRSPARRG